MTDWALLWCLIHHPHKHLILRQIREEHFSIQLSKDVYRLCKQLIDQNYDLEVSLIVSHIPEAKEYLEHVNADNYQAYINQIDDELFAKIVTGFGQDIASKKFNKVDFINNVNDIIQHYIHGQDQGTIFEAKEIVDEMMENIYDPIEEIDGIRTYIDSLDQDLFGLKPGDFVLIAGRPSMGKSSMLCWIASQNALAGNATLFFSLEMSKKLLMGRMFTSSLKIDLWKFKRRKFSPAERELIESRKNEFRDMPLIIDENGMLSIEDMEATIAEVSSKYDLKLIVVDYAQIMAARDINSSRNAQLTEISAAIKRMAKKYQLPIILASQLSRAVEQREDKRPVLSDLRDSGSLEQDADIVLMLYRDYYYQWNPNNKFLLEVLIRKFREGEIGKRVIEYNLDKQYMRAIQKDSELAEYAKKFEYSQQN